MPVTIHLIGNAHIDPVWLWDWREGLNEGLSTCRAMVDMLEEFPEFRFIRGEAAIYEHIERHDPGLFVKIRRLIGAGRWDVVGGNYIQPDTNLPATEPLLRQFLHGKDYFRRKFGLEVKAAWAADSFGHAAGLPEILSAAGIEFFAFSRPQPKILPLPKQAFWWRAASGARVLAFRPHDGWYASERPEFGKRLDACLSQAAVEQLENVALFYGLGNHGGGPTRAHLREIRFWIEKHPGVDVEHSGLHRFFSALRCELMDKKSGFIPTIEGELNFCLRGCSASVAKFKFLYRRTEAQVLRAERSAAAIAAATGTLSESLMPSWKALLFNSFHDILPGSSIERAYDDQLTQLGGAFAFAQRAEADSLLDLARRVDTRPKTWRVAEESPQPVPFLIWNSHPYPIRTHVELEASLDYRPLWNYRNRAELVPVAISGPDGRLFEPQRIAEEHDSLLGLPWRWRAVVPVSLPPLGWQIWHLGLNSSRVKTPRPRKINSVKALGETGITNGLLKVIAQPGAIGIKFRYRQRSWLAAGLQVRLYEDPWGSWGGMEEETDSWLLKHERERWTVRQVQLLESGPERAALWVRFAGKRSRLDLTFFLARDGRHLEIRARTFLDERSARLKLVLPAGGPAEYAVPGGVTTRASCGEVPGGRWVRAGLTSTPVGFASDSLYGFDSTRGEFRATIARASRYASDVNRSPQEKPWMPAADCGELRFRFLLTPDLDRLPELADQLEEPPVVMTVPAQRGPWAPEGAIADQLTTGFRLLALRQLGRNIVELRLQNMKSKPLSASLTWLGVRLPLGRVNGKAIASWRLTLVAGRWLSSRIGQ